MEDKKKESGKMKWKSLLKLNISAMRLSFILFSFLLPYYRRHTPKKTALAVIVW